MKNPADTAQRAAHGRFPLAVPAVLPVELLSTVMVELSSPVFRFLSAILSPFAPECLTTTRDGLFSGNTKWKGRGHGIHPATVRGQGEGANRCDRLGAEGGLSQFWLLADTGSRFLIEDSVEEAWEHPFHIVTANCDEAGTPVHRGVGESSLSEDAPMMRDGCGAHVNVARDDSALDRLALAVDVAKQFPTRRICERAEDRRQVERVQ